MECPEATKESLKKLLEIIDGPVQSLNIYEPDPNLVRKLIFLLYLVVKICFIGFLWPLKNP